MNTEITDNVKVSGWVLYDADCRVCIRLARRFQNALARRRFELLPLQTPWVKTRLALSDSQLLAEMRLLKPDGKIFSGADALLEISRLFWWAWPFRQLAGIPAAMKSFRAGYRWFALHRQCAGGACATQISAVKKRSRLFDFLPLLVLPVLALMLRAQVASWIFMWAMAGALYAGCKWLTFREAAVRAKPDLIRSLGYLLAWPGMNATEFLHRQNSTPKPRGVEWWFAAAKTGCGACLLWGITRTLLPAHPLAAGWMGMAGTISVLHFGSFHLLSLAWRRAGIAATPVMQNPLRATSLAEFWGRRWNTAFNELAVRFAFHPLRRLAAPAVATMLVFGLSGLIHELVISLPARGGYGLPTLYFLVQGFGILGERSRFGQKTGLGRGARGRIFTIALTAGPAFWLFHPPFVKNVILPMLAAIGAT